MPLTMSKTSRLPAHSEHELVAAVRGGDEHAFEELYARFRERISTFIVSKVHDHGRAEDIAQEVFMAALRRLRASDQTIAFKPWIYEIAKNACIDEFRRGNRAREVSLESDGEFVVDRQMSAVSAVPTPAAAIESKQRLNDLRGAFGGLSATHHQLLVMREFEGMSYNEIGARLDMTRQMVESTLFRARRKLNEEYQEIASGQRCEQIQTAIDDGRLRPVGSLGPRDRRRFARHLAHCQPCRRTPRWWPASTRRSSSRAASQRRSPRCSRSRCGVCPGGHAAARRPRRAARITPPAARPPGSPRLPDRPSRSARRRPRWR